MASLHQVYGSPSVTADRTDGGFSMENSFALQPIDATPKAVALTVLLAAAVLVLLKYYGFRFNFGVAGGRA